MLRAEIRKLLFDLPEARERIPQFTAGRNFPDYQAGPLLRSAV